MTDATLIADIGGTNARFALTRGGGGFADLQVIETSRFPALADAARHYLNAAGARISAAVIAGAGPAIGGRIQLTNCPWTIEAAPLKHALGIGRITLVNDFEALAHALPLLTGPDTRQIGGGRPGAGPKLILGPGTGFGAALYIARAGRGLVVPTEAGHVALGITDIAGFPLVETGGQENGRISVEGILSGRGISRLHAALCRRAGAPEPPREAAEIVNAALEGSDGLARETVTLFCSILGSVAGDLALATGASGGVYIAGGIAPRMIDIILSGDFRARFDAKAPMLDYMAGIPAHIVTHPQPALLGLARLAGA